MLSLSVVEWGVISSSRGSFQVRDQTRVSCISCIGRQILYHWAAKFSTCWPSISIPCLSLAWNAVSLAPALVSSLRSCVSICFPGDSNPYTCENHRLIRFGAWGFVCLDARGPKRGGFLVGIWILVLVSVPGKRERRRKFSYMKRRITSLVTGNSGAIHECRFYMDDHSLFSERYIFMTWFTLFWKFRIQYL